MPTATPRSNGKACNSPSVTSGVRSTWPRRKPACASIRPERRSPPLRSGADLAPVPPSTNPTDRAGNTHAKTRRRLSSRCPRLNRRDNTHPKIVGKALHHACWPPLPAQRVNHKSAQKGIPFRLKQLGIRSSCAQEGLRARSIGTTPSCRILYARYPGAGAVSRLKPRWPCAQGPGWEARSLRQRHAHRGWRSTVCPAASFAGNAGRRRYRA